MDVQIISDIEECFFSSAEFEQQLMSTTYLLGQEDTDVQLPEILATPNCGFDPEVKNFVIQSKTLPMGYTMD